MAGLRETQAFDCWPSIADGTRRNGLGAIGTGLVAVNQVAGSAASILFCAEVKERGLPGGRSGAHGWSQAGFDSLPVHACIF